jgi:hypothetical protein
MTPPRTRFDEPILKAAVRRAWGRERAPWGLRRRVKDALTDENSTDAGAATHDVIGVAPSFWRRRIPLAAAAAAALALGVGLIVLKTSRPGHQPPVATVTESGASAPAPMARATQLTALLPTQLGEQIVRGHDLCVRVHPEQHHFVHDAPKSDFAAIARSLEAKVKHRVIATAVGDDWDFRGASLCPVGTKRVAHLMYRQGDAYLSVYSLPAAAAPSVENHQTCDAEINGRAIAGFVEDGGFYCVVASSGATKPVDGGTVRAMRDRVRATVIAARGERHEALAMLARVALP